MTERNPTGQLKRRFSQRREVAKERNEKQVSHKDTEDTEKRTAISSVK